MLARILLSSMIFLSVQNVFSEEKGSADDSAVSDPGSAKRWRFGLGVGYSFARDLVFPVGDQNGTLYSYRYSGNGAWVLAAEANYGGPRSYGVQIGVAVDGTRTITDFEETSNGTTTKGSYTGSAQPKVNFFNFYANVYYRWTKFYLPFGLNHTVVGITEPPVPLKDISGGTGIQFGLGWEFTKNLASELLIRVLTMTGKKQTSATAGTVNSGPGYLAGASIGLKLMF